MRYIPLLILLVGCAPLSEMREGVYEKSMKVFDEVEYRYHRKGNTIRRELMAIGDEKIVPDDDLNVPGLP